MTWEVAHHASLLDTIRLPAGTAAGVRRSLARTGPGRPTSKDRPGGRIRAPAAADEKAGGAVAAGRR